jgi:hypothetical protein
MAKNCALFIGFDPISLESIPPGCWIEYEARSRRWFLVCPGDDK